MSSFNLLVWWELFSMGVLLDVWTLMYIQGGNFLAKGNKIVVVEAQVSQLVKWLMKLLKVTYLSESDINITFLRMKVDKTQNFLLLSFFWRLSTKGMMWGDLHIFAFQVLNLSSYNETSHDYIYTRCAKSKYLHGVKK